MGLLSRYVFRQTAGALLLILISLTGVTWIAIALRQLELMTTQGQDVMRFLGMTTLAIPGLLAFIAPVALLIASIHVLNKLNGDSELIVMTAGGMPVWSLLKPLGLLALLVSLSVAAVNHVAGPWSQRKLKDMVVQVRTDFMSQVLQPWRFSSPEAKLTVHIRDRAAERRPARPAAARCARSQADRHLPRRARADHQAGSGRLPAHGEGPRAAPLENEPAPQIISFQSYPVDMNRLEQRVDTVQVLRPRERFTTELLRPGQERSAVQGEPRAVHLRVARAPVQPVVCLCFCPDRGGLHGPGPDHPQQPHAGYRHGLRRGGRHPHPGHRRGQRGGGAHLGDAICSISCRSQPRSASMLLIAWRVKPRRRTRLARALEQVVGGIGRALANLKPRPRRSAGAPLATRS